MRPSTWGTGNIRFLYLVLLLVCWMVHESLYSPGSVFSSLKKEMMQIAMLSLVIY